MRFLKQNTATRITVGPMLDKTDGITPEIALTVTNCLLTFTVDDAGVPTLVIDAAPTASGGDNDMVHITSDAAGFYDLELTAAQTNYVGRAMLAITDAANHCPVFHEFTILPANVYDSLMGTDKLDVNAAEVGGTVQTGRDIGASVLVSVGTGAGQINASGGKVPATVAAADVTGNVTADVQTIKTQTVTCAAGVTVLASVGTAATDTAQTGDSFARLGAPAGASVSADVAAVKAQTAAIETDTQDIQTQVGTAGAGLTAIGDTRMAKLDATVSSRLASAGYTTPPTVGAIADQVWDEVITGHGGALTTGAALSAAGSAGDPWSTAIPGAYGTGTAGKAMADIKAKTDLIPAAGPADAAQFTAARAAKLDSIGGAVASVTAPVAVDSASINALKAAQISTVFFGRKG